MLDRAPACSVIGNLSTVQALMIPTLSPESKYVVPKPDLRVNSVGHLILGEGFGKRKRTRRRRRFVPDVGTAMKGSEPWCRTGTYS